MALMGTTTLALLILVKIFCSTVSANCPSLSPAPTIPATPTPPPKNNHGSCPMNTLKLGACIDLLHNIVNWAVGTPPSEPCCSSLNGLAAIEDAICLCTAIKTSLVGVNIDIPVAVSWLVSTCGHQIPPGFRCA